MHFHYAIIQQNSKLNEKKYRESDIMVLGIDDTQTKYRHHGIVPSLAVIVQKLRLYWHLGHTCPFRSCQYISKICNLHPAN